MSDSPFSSAYRWRQPRLARGWTTVQLIGRMKIVADHDGVALPRTWHLDQLLFLWENRHAPMPGYYASVLSRIFDRPCPVRRERWEA
jgi:hypothetical protein